jgi:hypothetical protein
MISPPRHGLLGRLKSEKHSRLRLYLILVSPFIIYLLISLAYFGPSSLGMIKHSMFESNPDSQLIVWSINWWPFSLTHHLNPFVSKYIWAPQGFNLTWATSVPALGIIMWPITSILGATASYNLLALLSPALGGLSCFGVVYYLRRDYLSSLLAGYMFGFSSYELGELLGHPSLYIDFLVPLLVLVFLARLRGNLSKRAFIILSAALLVVQFGISNEIFASLLFFGFIAIASFYIFSTVKQRQDIKTTTQEFGWAILSALLILSPYLYYMAVGYKAVPKTLNSPFLYSSDTLNYIIPTAVTRLGSTTFQTTVSRFTGNVSEDGAYIGLPLLLITIYFLVRYRRKSYVKPLGLILFITILTGLGTHLKVGGHITKVLLPWEIFTRVPLIKSALPDRFSMYTGLIVAIIVGLWIAQKTTATKRRLKLAMVLFGILFILPNPKIYIWQKVPTPDLFTSSSLTKYVKPGSNVIILPYDSDGNSMYYQVVSGMRFTQAGGYIGFTPKSFAADPALQSLGSGLPTPNFNKDLYNFCVSHKVKDIIYPQANLSSSIAEAINSTGWRRTQAGGEVIVKVSYETH